MAVEVKKVLVTVAGPQGLVSTWQAGGKVSTYWERFPVASIRVRYKKIQNFGSKKNFSLVRVPFYYGL